MALQREKEGSPFLLLTVSLSAAILGKERKASKSVQLEAVFSHFCIVGGGAFNFLLPCHPKTPIFEERKQGAGCGGLCSHAVVGGGGIQKEEAWDSGGLLLSQRLHATEAHFLAACLLQAFARALRYVACGIPFSPTYP